MKIFLLAVAVLMLTSVIPMGYAEQADDAAYGASGPQNAGLIETKSPPVSTQDQLHRNDYHRLGTQIDDLDRRMDALERENSMLKDRLQNIDRAVTDLRRDRGRN